MHSGLSLPPAAILRPLRRLTVHGTPPRKVGISTVQKIRYSFLLRALAATRQGRCSASAATAIIGRPCRSRRTTAVACTSTRRTSARWTATTEPTASPCVPSKNRREAPVRLIRFIGFIPCGLQPQGVYRRSRSKKFFDFPG